MALPAVEQGVMDLVKEDEAEQKRQAALSAVNGEVAEDATVVEDSAEVSQDAGSTNDAAEAAETTSQALSTVSAGAVAVAAVSAGNLAAQEFLAEEGFDELKLDFASFPTVTLDNEVFNSPEHKAFAKKFECVIMQQGKQFLFRGETGKRDDTPELVYSDDGIHNNKAEEDGTRKPIAWYLQDWKSRGMDTSKTEYKVLYVQMVESDDNPHSGEVCRLQVPPASRTKLDGYLTQLGWRKLSPRSVVTEVSVGATVGQGIKAFNPWVFKQARKAV